MLTGDFKVSRVGLDMEEEKEETEMPLLPGQWCCPNTCAVWNWQVFTVGSVITGFPCWEPLHLLPTDPLPLHQFLGIHISSFSTKVYHSPNIQHEQDLGSLHTKSFHPRERPVPFHGSTPGAQASSDAANFPLLHCGRIKAWFSLEILPTWWDSHSSGPSPAFGGLFQLSPCLCQSLIPFDKKGTVAAHQEPSPEMSSL